MLYFYLFLAAAAAALQIPLLFKPFRQPLESLAVSELLYFGLGLCFISATVDSGMHCVPDTLAATEFHPNLRIRPPVASPVGL